MPIPLPTPKEMNAWDKAAIEEFGISQEVLMENAGRMAFRFLIEQTGCPDGKYVYIFAGGGNNGGDGFVVARYLKESGANVTVFHAREESAYRGAAVKNFTLALKTGVKFFFLPKTNTDSLYPPDIVVDGLLGTGFSGDLKPPYTDWIDLVNSWRDRAFIFALDVPSGLNALTGQPSVKTVIARATATFEADKIGLFMPVAAKYAGNLRICPIGIPASVRESHPVTHYGLDDRVVAHLPPDDPMMHKGMAGHAAVLGGSDGLSGAARLCALAHLRSGAGLVTVFCPAAVTPEIKSAFPEVMSVDVAQGRTWDSRSAEKVAPRLSGLRSLTVGPGMGRNPECKDFLTSLLEMSLPPAVLDADALFALAGDRSLCKLLGEDFILTPHPGEAARLLGVKNEQVVADMRGAARALTALTGAIAVVKGPGTAIALPDGNVHLSPFACSNLAVGGSGDVLAGLIGGYLAQGVKPAHAAMLGVYLHGLCGVLSQGDYPHRGLLAREILNYLPAAISRIKREKT